MTYLMYISQYKRTSPSPFTRSVVTAHKVEYCCSSHEKSNWAYMLLALSIHIADSYRTGISMVASESVVEEVMYEEDE